MFLLGSVLWSHLLMDDKNLSYIIWTAPFQVLPQNFPHQPTDVPGYVDVGGEDSKSIKKITLWRDLLIVRTPFGHFPECLSATLLPELTIEFYPGCFLLQKEEQRKAEEDGLHLTRKASTESSAHLLLYMFFAGCRNVAEVTKGIAGSHLSGLLASLFFSVGDVVNIPRV